MPWTVNPPTYNHRYGYNDGAQEDIFIAAPSEPLASATLAAPYNSLPSSTSSISDSSSSTALPTNSTLSNGARGLGVGYRIPGMSNSVLDRQQLMNSTFVCTGCSLRLPRDVSSLEALMIYDVRLL